MPNNGINGVAPIDLMKKAQISTECEVCGEELVTFADTTDDLGAQLADVYVVHLFDEHIDSMPVTFDPETEHGIANEIATMRGHLVEQGIVEYTTHGFVVQPRDESGADNTDEDRNTFISR